MIVLQRKHHGLLGLGRDNTSKPRRNPRTALMALGCCVAIQAAVAQRIPELTTATPEYKCHVQVIEGGENIIRFYSRKELPVRFSDGETFAQAPVSDSLKASVSTVYECVRIPEQFSDPGAVALEQRLPR